MKQSNEFAQFSDDSIQELSSDYKTRKEHRKERDKHRSESRKHKRGNWGE